MAIDPKLARADLNVFYQQPHMQWPEYGRIISVSEPVFIRRGFDPCYYSVIVRVLFMGDTTPKPCHPDDLHWPPSFCARDGVNPPGQPWSDPDGLRVAGFQDEKSRERCP